MEMILIDLKKDYARLWLIHINRKTKPELVIFSAKDFNQSIQSIKILQQGD